MKSFAVEGTAFWLVVSAILTGGSAYGAPLALAALALAYAVVYAIVAFFAWNHKKWAFVLAIVIALVALVGNVVFGGVEGLATVTGFGILSAGAWLSIPQFLVIFYSLRAYREPAAA
jgi:hypothetical protein